MRPRFADMDCPIARSLDVVGEPWTLLIVRDAYFGIRRFEEFRRRLGIARNVLAARLERLVDAGVLRRQPYQERPLRQEYRLTERGRELLPVLLALRDWGARWQAVGDPAVRVEHAGCGAADVRAVATCSECGEPLLPLDVRAHGALVPERRPLR